MRPTRRLDRIQYAECRRLQKQAMEERIVRLYVRAKLTIREIGAIVRLHQSNVHRCLLRHGVTMRPREKNGWSKRRWAAWEERQSRQTAAAVGGINALYRGRRYDEVRFT